jgi:hypothetical protein
MHATSFSDECKVRTAYRERRAHVMPFYPDDLADLPN